MADEQVVSENSTSPLAEAIASSPEALEQTQETQTPAKEGETQGQVEQQAEEARVPYSRLKEVVDEKNWLKQQLEMQLQRQQTQQPQQPTTVSQELGNTPEEREFFRGIRQIAAEEAERKMRQVNPVIEAGRMELAQIKVQQFRANHSDVKPNSPEEIAIAEKIQMGYLPEDAYRSVMWDIKVADAENRGNTNVKQKIEAKKQANVENKSIPAGANLPTNKKIPLRQRIQAEADKMGDVW